MSQPDFSGQVALVTGASRGIGRAVAAALAASGCHVLINYRSRQPEAAETLARIQHAGGSGELYPFDVADVAACGPAVAGIIQTHKRIDVLVNNAGIRHDSLMVFMPAEQWSQVIATNLNSFFNVTQPVVKQMALQRRGRIVTIASTAGFTANGNNVPYGAAKAGITGLTRQISLEALPEVRVNCIAPGRTVTGMTTPLMLARGGDMEQGEKIFGAKIPMQRMGTAAELAAAICFFLSEDASFITGQTLLVDGGETIT